MEEQSELALVNGYGGLMDGNMEMEQLEAENSRLVSRIKECEADLKSLSKERNQLMELSNAAQAELRSAREGGDVSNRGIQTGVLISDSFKDIEQRGESSDVQRQSVSKLTARQTRTASIKKKTADTEKVQKMDMRRKGLRNWNDRTDYY